jgi:uncharacterized membrane protein (UPF0136 family)
MDSSCPEFRVNFEGDGFVIDVNSLYVWLSRLQDRRKKQGLRYGLVIVLVMIVLAKLAGQDRVSGIAEWIRHRASLLAGMLVWKRKTVPHRTTLSRILGWAVDILN